MPSVTWSLNNTGDGSRDRIDNASGSNTFTLTSTGGTLPSNATVTGIDFSIGFRTSGYHTSQKFRLTSLGITDGPSIANYREKQSAGTNEDTIANSFTSAEIINTSAFSNENIIIDSIKISRINSSGSVLSTTIYARLLSITVTYTLPAKYVTKPENFKINDSTSYVGMAAVLTWDASTVSGGSGTITYHIMKVIDGGSPQQIKTLTGTTYTLENPETYVNDTTLYVYGTASGADDSPNSDSVTYRYSSSTLGSVRLNTTKAKSGSPYTIKNADNKEIYIPASSIGISSIADYTAFTIYFLLGFSNYGTEYTFSYTINFSDGDSITKTFAYYPSSIEEIVSVQISFDGTYKGKNITSIELYQTNYNPSTDYHATTKYDTASGTVYSTINKDFEEGISAPSNLKVSNLTSYQGPTCTLTWTASAVVGTEEPIKYTVYVGSTVISSDVRSTMYTIPNPSSYTSLSTIKVKATSGWIESGYSNTVNYVYGKLNGPTNIKIHNSLSYVGPYIQLTWTKSVTENLTSAVNVNYKIYAGTDNIGNTTGDTLSVTDLSVVQKYTSNTTIKITASYATSYNTLTADGANTVVYKYDEKILGGITDLKVDGKTSFRGKNLPLTWSKPTTKNITGNITYTIKAKVGGSTVTIDTYTPPITDTNISYTVYDESKLEPCKTQSTIYVEASADRLTSTSNEVSYIYFTSATISRWNGSSWEQCVIYRWNGSSWEEVLPYRWNGSSWVLISST